jgi:2-polyprenyl-3-methyl-5-hydroxy-6-metoxy-1,4-benzoquinol methylase
MPTLAAPASQTVLTSALVWDETACPLCAAWDFAPVLRAPDATRAAGPVFQVVRCLQCGLHYTNPRPDANSIAQFYPTDYPPHHKQTRARNPHRWPLLARWTGHPCPERHTLPVFGTGRLLDFGCGNGIFLQRMAAQGWDVLGLDTSADVVARVQTDFGLPALVGTLPHPHLTPGSFSVITLWHALEHVHQPLAVLRAAYRLLAPGGRLIVATPNVASWPFQLFGQHWFALDLPRHLTHFAPATLRAMLTQASFSIASFRQLRHSEWLRHSAEQAYRQDRARWQRALACKPIARAVAWAGYLAGRADCMIAVAQK